MPDIPYIDEKTRSRILKLIRKGNPMEIAAASCGIPRETLHKFIYRGNKERARRKFGKEPDPKYTNQVEFAVQLEEAKAYAQIDMLDKATQLALDNGKGHGDWRAFMTILARINPKRWSEKVTIRVEDEIRDIIAKLQDNLDEETFIKVLEIMRDESNNS